MNSDNSERHTQCRTDEMVQALKHLQAIGPSIDVPFLLCIHDQLNAVVPIAGPTVARLSISIKVQ